MQRGDFPLASGHAEAPVRPGKPGSAGRPGVGAGLGVLGQTLLIQPEATKSLAWKNTSFFVWGEGINGAGVTDLHGAGNSSVATPTCQAPVWFWVGICFPFPQESQTQADTWSPASRGPQWRMERLCHMPGDTAPS